MKFLKTITQKNRRNCRTINRRNAKVYTYQDMLNIEELIKYDLPYTYQISSEYFLKHIKDYAGTFTLPEGYKLYIDYPLSNPAVFLLDECKSGYDLLKQIKDAYLYVYNTENETSDIVEQTIADAGIGKLLNRVHTNGDFGIWGHVLEDLVLENIYIQHTNKCITLGIGS